MSGGSSGVFAKLAMDPSSITSGSEAYDFNNESLAQHVPLVIADGIAGTRSRLSSRVRQGVFEVGGSITLEPTPVELDHLLPRILGAAGSGTTFALAETLPSFVVAVLRGPKVFTYSGCYVNKATFRFTEKQLVALTLDIIGTSEAIGTSFPSLTLDSNPPYIFYDAASGLTIQSSSRTFMAGELTIDNKLQTRFANSQTLTAVLPEDREVMLKVTTPWTSSETDLLTGPLASVTNESGSATLTFTNGSNSIAFSFPDLHGELRSPVVGGRNEIKLETTYRALGAAGTEISVTNAHS
jgi:Phage tail tube protein